MSITNIRILAVCNHPGGVNAILPVIELFKEKCLVITTSRNAGLLRDLDIRHKVLSEQVTESCAEEILVAYQPDLILLGTSEPEDPKIGRLEAIFTSTARKLKMSSVSVLDSWINARDRYSLSSAGLLDALPDLICVMDDQSRQKLDSLGFPLERLTVTGNPHFDRLSEIRQKMAKVDKVSIRKNLGIAMTEKVILFLSQPLIEDRRTNLGFNEIEVLEDIALASPTALILVKPHPRESASKYKSVENDRIKIVNLEIDIYQLGLAADVVVGMFTMLLYEYSLLGFRTISYQPGNTKIDLGYEIKIVNSRKQLAASLRKCQKNNSQFSFPAEATDKIVQFIGQMGASR